MDPALWYMWLLILAVMYKFSENPFLVFFIYRGHLFPFAYAVNSIVESEFHVRLWNYEQYFLNINGRIYIGGSIEFCSSGLRISVFPCSQMEPLIFKT